MIKLSAAQMENIGFRYALDALELFSPYGEQQRRQLRMFGPKDAQELEIQLRNVNGLMTRLATYKEKIDRLDRLLMQLKDIRRTVERCRDVALSEIELFELKRFTLQLELIAPSANELMELADTKGIRITKVEGALNVLDTDSARGATFFINDSHSDKLLAARKAKREIERQLRAQQDVKQREKLNGIRVELAAQEDEEETRIRAELCVQLRPYVDELLANMDMIGALDFTIARARLAQRYGGVLPEIGADELRFDDMINPRIADALLQDGRAFTPVSIAAGAGATVITGANMGGKSIALKTLALGVLLVHAGMLPFASRAQLPLFDGMFIVSEDLENIERGLSSFGAEIVRFNEVMAAREQRSLILLDEFARGTNPDEGAQIVRGTTRYLDGLSDISVLTTHYDGVAQYASRHYQVAGLRDMDMRKVRTRIGEGADGISAIAECMNYGLYEVHDNADCPRDALNICRLLSFPDEILEYIESLY
ncbi:MAG: DNA mismatch repair protein MutS [Clostridia bacterium]